MSYQTVKDMIKGLMESLGYVEASGIKDFKDVPVNEFNNNFIVKCSSGEMVEPDSETLSDRFYDRQAWKIQIAFSVSSQNDIIDRDEMHASKDLILATLDKPGNWSASVRFMKYKAWSIEENPNYLILTVALEIQDVYTY